MVPYVAMDSQGDAVTLVECIFPPSDDKVS